MKTFSKLTATVLFGLCLSGCSTFDDSNDDEIPELAAIEAKFSPTISWQEQVGDGVEHHFSRLAPTIHNGVVYAASREGIVTAIGLDSGDEIWSIDLREKAEGMFSFGSGESARVGGGLSVAYGKLFLGTEHGEVIALNIDSGDVLWRQKVVGEVIAPVTSGEGLVFVNTAAGQLIALHPDDGDQRWKYEQEVPPLTLRGISAPVFENGGVILGSANGKLNVIIAQSGLEAWNQSVATAVGASELERLVDVDTKVQTSGTTIYSLAYNGNLIAVDMQSGGIKWKKEYSSYRNLAYSTQVLYLTDVTGHVYAVSALDGSKIWQQSALKSRGLTGVYAQDEYLVIGDSLGVLHWLDKETGELVSRIELDSTGFYVDAVGDKKRIVVMTRDGEVSAIDTP